MPFRSLATLSSWLDEFRQLEDIAPGWLKVVPQDGDDGADTGLVACRLENSSLAYLQPDREGSATWVVTFEPREQPVTMAAEDVGALAHRLTLVSALCSFLQAKSEAFVGLDSA